MSVAAQELVRIDHVSKKYCRQLKRSLRYGLIDVWQEITARKGNDRMQLRDGEFFAVRDVSFSVPAGQCVALLGPNGAGKSTLLKMLCGLIKPDAGKIAIRGRIGTLIELGTGFNPILSGRENVYVNASVLGLTKRETDRRFDEIVDFAELHDVIDTPVKTYSSGMRVRLGFAVAAHLRPHVLLVDEVLAVGDVGFRMKCFRHLQQLSEQGVAIILVSHAVGMLPRVCHRAVVFSRGRLAFDGDLERGIATYEQLMQVPSEQRAARETASSDDASIDSVQLCDPRGQPISELHTGQAAQLVVRVSARKRVEGARLIVALHSPSSGVVSSVSTPFQNFHFRCEPPGCTIALHLPALPLLVGGYHFNVSLFGPELTDFYHRRMNVASFRVVGPPIDANGRGINGLIRLEHSWSELSHQEPAAPGG